MSSKYRITPSDAFWIASWSKASTQPREPRDYMLKYELDRAEELIRETEKPAILGEMTKGEQMELHELAERLLGEARDFAAHRGES